MTLRRGEAEQVWTKDFCQDPAEVQRSSGIKTLNADIV
jgi:hypothetical protein